MLVGSHVQLVVTLWEFDTEQTIFTALTLCHECTSDRILQDYLCTAYMWLLFCIISVLVSDINRQRTLQIGYGGNGEVDVGTIAVGTVDAKSACDGNVELHVGSRCHAQHNSSRIVLVQARHGGTCQRLHPVGQ